MLRLAQSVVQEDTSPVAINPFLGSGSLLVHPDAALARENGKRKWGHISTDNIALTGYRPELISIARWREPQESHIPAAWYHYRSRQRTAGRLPRRGGITPAVAA